MRRAACATALLTALSLLAGCVNLSPAYVRPEAPVAASWPTMQADSSPTTTTEQAADIAWRTFITDARLRRVVELSLQNNRNLRAAVANIELARARYRIDSAALLPQVDAAASISRQRSSANTGVNGQGSTTTQYQAALALSSYELDFFGRIRNLSEAGLENFLAADENRRSTHISLVAEVAGAWLTLATATERQQLARETLASQQASLDLTRRTRALGGTSGLAVAQAQTTVDSARLDLARYTTQAAQDRNALELLAGGPLPDEWLPAPTPAAAAAAAPAPTASLLVDVPAGLPSEVLQRRPDVRAAEHLLRAANADIGAARAALFPSILLTGSAGTQSRSLAGLFTAGSGFWSVVPQIDLPIFDAGERRANVDLSRAQRDIDLASYEGAVQAAFRDVADALAERGTLAEQLAAHQSLTDATQRSYTLSNALFKNGASSYLDVLDAQRSLYAVRQSGITLRLAEQTNRITLYRALGGGWAGEEGATR